MLLVVAAVAIGLECLLIIQPWNDIGVDFDRVIAAGRVWRAGGDPYGLSGYLYTPAMTAIASLLPSGTWAVWAVAELALILLLAPRTWWALLIAITWPGIWIDLALGNVTIALVAAAILAIRSDRRRSGLLLGVALALAPKPMFALFLLWLAFHRRQSLIGVLAGGLVATLAGVLVAGSNSYSNFAQALLTGVDSHFVGNYGLSFISPIAGIGAFLVVAVISLSCIRRPADGLMAVAIAGTFAGTYIGLYSTILPLAVLPLFAVERPSAAIRVAIAGLLSPFTLWLAGILAIASVVWRPDTRPAGDLRRGGPDSADPATEPA
jgi:Glycosyltransferase family 87